MQLTNEDFKNKLIAKHGNKIIAKEAYNGMRNIIKFHCNDCGFDWETSPLLALKANAAHNVPQIGVKLHDYKPKNKCRPK